MRNKKIISLICAISMIFSMIASLTIVAHAEGTQQGITLEIEQTSKTEATVTAKYSAEIFPEGITSALVQISVPSEATVTYTKPITTATYLENDGYEGKYVLNIGLSEAANPADKILTVFTISAPNGLSANATIALVDGTEIANMDTDVTLTYPEDLAPSSVVMKADPDAEEEEPMTKDTDYDKTKVEIPESIPEVVVGSEGGIVLTLGNTTDTSAEVIASYEGFNNGITSALIKISVPTGSTVTYTKPITTATYLENDGYEGMYVLNIGLSEAANPSDKVLTVFTITYPTDGLTEDFVCQLQEGSEIANMDDDKTLSTDDDLSKVTVILPATTEDDRNVVVLDEQLSSDVAKTADESEDDSYLAIEAKDEDGNPATYGDDYEAYYNGKKINEDTLKALLAGGVEGITLEDAVKGLSFKYNDGVKIKFQLVQGNTVVDSGETEEDEPDPGKDYTAKGKIASNVSKSIKSTDKKQSATFTITPAKDKNGADVVGDTTVTINVKRTSFDAITGSGIEVAYQTLEEDDDQEMDIVTGYQYLTINDAGYEYELPESLNDKYIVSFTPAAKGTVEYVITYTDANGDKSTATAKYTVSASSTSGSGSGSSSKDDDNKSSGGGAIATGIVDSGSSYLPSLGFDDLGDVTWAQTAINTLAAKKIVSGVGDNKFDPNAALTRAAYAQMLVNAIGHSTDSADTYYDDVPTDAWFYHNVAVASQLGIVSGFGDGTFRPNDLITREQMALMTQKAAVVMGKSLVGADAGTFTDDADIADWSRDAVYQLSNAGIINGMGDGTFAPQANATRAQAAVIIYNAFVK